MNIKDLVIWAVIIVLAWLLLTSEAKGFEYKWYEMGDKVVMYAGKESPKAWMRNVGGRECLVLPPDAWVEDRPGTVPLPGAIWMLGTGLVGLLGFKRRKKNGNI